MKALPLFDKILTYTFSLILEHQLRKAWSELCRSALVIKLDIYDVDNISYCWGVLDSPWRKEEVMYTTYEHEEPEFVDYNFLPTLFCCDSFITIDSLITLLHSTVIRNSGELSVHTSKQIEQPYIIAEYNKLELLCFTSGLVCKCLSPFPLNFCTIAALGQFWDSMGTLFNLLFWDHYGRNV